MKLGFKDLTAAGACWLVFKDRTAAGACWLGVSEAKDVEGGVGMKKGWNRNELAGWDACAATVGAFLLVGVVSMRPFCRP